jgi:hypothetical protein
VVSCLAIVAAIIVASRLAWVCDDAFISFRYADNLASGLGLVFNPGERVEGYTNLLWTLWLALASITNLDLERWSIGWGIAFHAATIVLLCWQARPATRRTVLLPIAAILAAAHRDEAVFATSGLEGALFGFLALSGFLAASGATTARRWAAAGALFALATSCRPDGAVFFAAAGVWAMTCRRPGVRMLTAYTLPFLVFVGALTAWRWRYYGDVLPNTYYAKSADVAWWEQGLYYASLYLRKYWAIVGTAGAGIILAIYTRHRDGRWMQASSRVMLAGLMVTMYTLGVVRAGGDFMYARLLVPLTPLLAVCAEFAIESIPVRGARRTLTQAIAAAACGIVLVLWPSPVSGSIDRGGVVDERAFYLNERPELGDGQRQAGIALQPFLVGLPITVVFVGAEARLVYYARPAVAIEAATGLTDRWIAHQALGKRGRPGHEKQAPPEYLFEARKAHLAFSPFPFDGLLLPVKLGERTCFLMRWDPAIVSALRSRGALIPDLPTQIDRFLEEAKTMPDSNVAWTYASLRRLYFSAVDDRRREAAFVRRLSLGHSPR